MHVMLSISFTYWLLMHYWLLCGVSNFSKENKELLHSKFCDSLWKNTVFTYLFTELENCSTVTRQTLENALRKKWCRATVALRNSDTSCFVWRDHFLIEQKWSQQMSIVVHIFHVAPSLPIPAVDDSKYQTASETFLVITQFRWQYIYTNITVINSLTLQ